MDSGACRDCGHPIEWHDDAACQAAAIYGGEDDCPCREDNRRLSGDLFDLTNDDDDNNEDPR